MTHTRPLLASAATGRGLPCLLAAASLLAASGAPALAQVQNFLLKPGSNVGPATEVKATDCVTQPDGTITCNTKLVNPPGDTPAKPIYSPFKN